MEWRDVKTFCKVVSRACEDGILSRSQAKTLMGQAKHGDLEGAKRGVMTIMGRC